MAGEETIEEVERGSSPASRGGAGAYIEGELGALYLLALLTGNPAVGLPAATVSAVRFQGVEQGFALDDLIVHATGVAGVALLEIQSKRDITFAPRDPIFAEVSAQIARTAQSCRALSTAPRQPGAQYPGQVGQPLGKAASPRATRASLTSSSASIPPSFNQPKSMVPTIRPGTHRVGGH
jgi:hypothetical protein